MKFRPCIDIHNGAVKQIVGGSLKDAGNAAVENTYPDRMQIIMRQCIRKMDLPEDTLFC